MSIADVNGSKNIAFQGNEAVSSSETPTGRVKRVVEESSLKIINYFAGIIRECCRVDITAILESRRHEMEEKRGKHVDIDKLTEQLLVKLAPEIEQQALAHVRSKGANFPSTEGMPLEGLLTDDDWHSDGSAAHN